MHCPTPRPTRILIVDDHQDIREPLATYLRRYGFDVTTAVDGVEMRALLAQAHYELIVLDVMLPGEDGFSLCRYVAERIATPVILLTAMDEQADRIAGLEIGADDYVVKPFDPRELVARIKSVLRRTTGPRAPEPVPVPAPIGVEGGRYGFEGWVFDTRRRELRDPAGLPVLLSTAEFHLLRVLVTHPNVVLSRNRLLDLTSRVEEASVFDRSIDSQVSRLRKKLELDPRKPSLIKTARGDGYLFAGRVAVLSP